MLKTDRIYKTLDGKRRFEIIAKKKVKTTHPYIGECRQTGFTTFFDASGRHCVESKYDLNTDSNLYLPVFPDGSVEEKFVPKSDIGDGLYIGYIKAIEGNVKNVVFISRDGID